MRELWVICERAKDGLREVSYELVGEAARLARGNGAEVVAVLPGDGAEALAAELCARGADRSLVIADQSLIFADELRHADELSALIEKYKPESVFFGATAYGRSVAPRVAARLGAGLTADCTRLEIDPQTGLLLQTRPAFGGNLLATIACPAARPQMATVRPKVFPVPPADPARPVRVVREMAASTASPLRVLESIAGKASVNIGDYDVLVSVGLGIGGAENIARAKTLARKLGGTLSASRPVVDSGLLPYARQVGQTGKAVSPKLYLALGISGAIQHMAGVSADVLVAVNADPEAAIFEHADFGLVMDCGAFLDEMLQ